MAPNFNRTVIDQKTTIETRTVSHTQSSTTASRSTVVTEATINVPDNENPVTENPYRPTRSFSRSARYQPNPSSSVNPTAIQRPRLTTNKRSSTLDTKTEPIIKTEPNSEDDDDGNDNNHGNYITVSEVSHMSFEQRRQCIGDRLGNDNGPFIVDVCRACRELVFDNVVHECSTTRTN